MALYTWQYWDGGEQQSGDGVGMPRSAGWTGSQGLVYREPGPSVQGAWAWSRSGFILALVSERVHPGSGLGAVHPGLGAVHPGLGAVQGGSARYREAQRGTGRLSASGIISL